ncbi:hypothetical protein TNCV_2965501 [Trichonephila clavipes]|nr:hypothetical protein TNCV_2965501 [Trichonephila clavipes]
MKEVLSPLHTRDAVTGNELTGTKFSQVKPAEDQVEICENKKGMMQHVHHRLNLIFSYMSKQTHNLQARKCPQMR